MVKKISRIVALMLVFSLICLALASCGKTLSGKYSSEDVLDSGVTYTFRGSKVTVTAKIYGFEKSFDGKYEIIKADDGTEQIKFTFESSDASEYAGTFSFSEDKDNKTITIGIFTYTKQ
ncbi:MAG: hypothetical protein ACI4QR_05825 [Eubacteriales bacterium]